MIIALCGSVRFKDTFDRLSEELDLHGHTALTLGMWGIGKNGYIDDDNPLKKNLEIAHKTRISLSDAILVVNVDGYIGKSTEAEIAFARQAIRHKQVFWFDIIKAPLSINMYPDDLSYTALGIEI